MEENTIISRIIDHVQQYDLLLDCFQCYLAMINLAYKARGIFTKNPDIIGYEKDLKQFFVQVLKIHNDGPIHSMKFFADQILFDISETYLSYYFHVDDVRFEAKINKQHSEVVKVIITFKKFRDENGNPFNTPMPVVPTKMYFSLTREKRTVQ